MRINHLLCLMSALYSCLWAGAQTLHLSGELTGNNLRDVRLYAAPMSDVSMRNAVQLRMDSTRFEGEIPVSSDGFYRISGANGGGQIIAPFYYPGDDKSVTLKLSLTDEGPQINQGADNQALSAFNTVYYRMGRELWTEGQNMTSDRLFAFLKLYQSLADSVAGHYACSEPVKQYLKIWAYTEASTGYDSYLHITRMRSEQLAFTLADLLPSPSEVLDTPMALYFLSTGMIISASLPKGTLSEKMAYLAENYSSEPVRQRVADYLIAGYIRSFNFNEHYEAGLAELTSVVETYGLDKQYIKDFKARKASVRGADFPADVLLTDFNGREVKISQYKGYYLYIDMWASWCGPCCREVPYLQALEKELKNDKVKFVSISIDKGTKEWKAKMEALNMQGNQLINQDNSLAEALNISGIPHFLIYDTEGKLLHYNAPRPSSGEKLKQLLEDLE